MRWARLLLFGIVASGCQTSALPDGVTMVRDVRFHIGDPVETTADSASVASTASDGPSWLQAEYDDGAWAKSRFIDLPAASSVLWIRTQVVLEDASAHRRPLGLLFAAMASHEVWWDGVRIARNGVVGVDAEREVPGQIQVQHAVPDRLAMPGPHQIVIRASAFHRGFRPAHGFWVMLVGPYDALSTLGRAHAQVALMGLSGLLVIALFSFMMFVAKVGGRAFLSLGFLCALAAMLSVAESWRSLFGYTYDWHLTRLVVVTGLSWLVQVTLMIFIVGRFPLSGGRAFIAATLLMATVPIFWFHAWDPKVIVGFCGVFPLAVVWCGRAVHRGLGGSHFALVGTALCAFVLYARPATFLDQNLYLALNALLLCLLGTHVLQVRQMVKDREAALGRSTRLELELLKKHIQPHFLLNTLNALSEWVEQDAKVAGRMIQLLGEEFRLFSQISAQRLIPMTDELRLCHMHLGLMSLRHERTYVLRASGVDEAAFIPPTVMHTLVENAITHCRDASAQVEFRLDETTDDRTRCYRFISPYDDAAFEEQPGGMGLNYVRVRLEESMGPTCVVRAGPEAHTWVTEIRVPLRVSI